MNQKQRSLNDLSWMLTGMTAFAPRTTAIWLVGIVIAIGLLRAYVLDNRPDNE